VFARAKQVTETFRPRPQWWGFFLRCLLPGTWPQAATPQAIWLAVARQNR
jgi:hypothetical protein